MRVSCPDCGAPVPASDVSLENLAAKCRACDSVFAIGALGVAPRPARRPPLPSGLTIAAGEPPLPSPEAPYRAPAAAPIGELEIRRRWFEWQHLFLIFFCVFWDGFLVVWYAVAIGGVFMGEVGPGLAALVFPLLHVAVGVGLTYKALTGLLNTSVVRVANGTLSVRHGPLPWPGNRELPVASLHQLYVRRREQRGRRGGLRISYELLAATDDELEVSLLKKLPLLEQARYIEWVVEEHLGIEDDPSYGDA